MKIKIGKVSRLTYGLAAISLTAAISASMVVPGLLAQASAAQVTARSIQMSNSTQGTTGNTYKVAFNPGSGYTLKGIIVDFCDTSPIPGDSCTLPTGFSLTGSPAIANAWTTPSGGWTVASSNSNRTFSMTNTTGTAVTTGTNVTFEVTTVTNPTTDNHSFYARIFTYTSATTGYTTGGSGNEGTPQDYGGIALSTGKLINITAKVMETLSFCVYADDAGGGAGTGTCGGTADITIGHAVGSAVVISTSAVDTALVNFSLSTNAQTGAAVNLKGDTLKSGSNDIDAAGASAAAIVAGTEKFGMRISTAGTNITKTAPYNDATNYGFDTTSTTSTYGDQICTLSGPTNASVSTLTFAATAGNTTPAGTYTGAEQLIATGTF